MDTSTSLRATTGIEAIAGYRIKKLLDQGGMGGVYLAEDENLERLVAIKVINPELSDHPEAKRRFTREALIVAAFQHANIVTVYASGWLDEKQYIVMEYVSGGTLGQRMSAEKLTVEAAGRIAYQMADALAYSHERSVIHRDFKPNNILLRDDRTAVLSDFGVAKAVGTRGSETAIGMVIGSHGYMAPEQALGRAISDRVDIYSFGLVLHEMLAGELPARHPTRTVEDKRTLARAVPSAYADLIVRCLQAEPEDRPSALECREWLQSAANKSAPVRLGWKKLLAVAAGLAAVLALGIVVLRMGMFSHGADAQAPPTDNDAAASTAVGAGTSSQPRAVSASGTRMTLTVERHPPAAKILVDGSELAGPSIELSAGRHEVIAIAPGFYGDIRRLAPSSSQAIPISISLVPTALPTAAEEQKFLKLADAPTVTLADVQSISEQTLHTALQMKLLRQSGHAIKLEELARRAQRLQRFGDARAAVTEFLVDGMRAGQLSRSAATQPLIAASDSGDAMASLFFAMSYRDAMAGSTATVSASQPQFRSYCQRMGLAATQGWTDVATEYRRRDHCPD
jgi:hypothetical protein